MDDTAANCNWMDLLAGREGFAPDLPHSYEASEASRRDCTPDSKRGGYPTPPIRQFSKTFTWHHQHSISGFIDDRCRCPLQRLLSRRS